MTNNLLTRTVPAILTNKSGGGLNYGDVVILGAASAKAFTTTTTAGYRASLIGVIIEPAGIADNAQGKVATHGWVPQINLSGAATLYDFIKTHSVAGQGVSHAAPMQLGDFAIALQASATPEAILFGSPMDLTGALILAATGQLAGLTEEVAPASGDWFLMEDAATGGLKKVDSDNLPGGVGGADPNHGYYQYLAAMLEPDAIETLKMDSFSYAVASNVTKILTSSWNTRLGASGRLEARNPKMPTFLRGVTLAGLGSGATGVIIDPALPTYADAREKYFDRLLTLAESAPLYLPVTSTTGVPFLCGAYGAIILQVTNYDFAWIALRFANDVYGINLDNEVSDSTSIRFANVPYMAVNKLVCNEIRGAGGASQNGSVLYYLCPSTWSVIADPNTYDFRDDFMGASLDTATEWSRTQTGGTVEIDTQHQWLKLIGTSTWGNNGCHSQSSISRASGKIFLIDIYTGNNATANNSHLVGWHDGAGDSYTDFSHGLLFTSDGGAHRLKVYENGNDRGYVGNNPGYANRTTYRVKITLDSAGANSAKYEIQGGAYGTLGSGSWTNITPGTTSSSTTPVHAGIAAGQTGTMFLGDARIY